MPLACELPVLIEERLYAFSRSHSRQHDQLESEGWDCEATALESTALAVAFHAGLGAL